MDKNLISNWVTESYPRFSTVKARHKSGEMREATVTTHVVEGAAQNVPTGVIVEFADNSMATFEQGELQAEVNIKPARS